MRWLEHKEIVVYNKGKTATIFGAHIEEERNRRLITTGKVEGKWERQTCISSLLTEVREVTIELLELIKSTNNGKKWMSMVTKIEIHGTWRGRGRSILLMYLVMESFNSCNKEIDIYEASSSFNTCWIVFVIFLVIVGFSGIRSILNVSQVTWKRSSCSLERIMKHNSFWKTAVKSLTGCLRRYFTRLWSSFCLGWWTRLQ